MVYTIQIDLFIDSDDIMSKEDIETFIKGQINGTSVGVSDFKLIEIND